jgi:hypothetical protein
LEIISSLGGLGIASLAFAGVEGIVARSFNFDLGVRDHFYFTIETVRAVRFMVGGLKPG